MTDLDPTNAQLEADAPGHAAAPSVNPYESALVAAPASPVVGPASALRRRPVRWPVAIALIALVLAVSAFVGILVTGRAPNAKVLGYVPDGTIAYGEARLDLPGDQRLALAAFLSKFPGFADQAAIEGKLNEIMDRIVGGATNGEQAYTSDISPWFDGELAFALGALPDPTALSSGRAAAMDGERVLFLISVKDEAGASAWLRGIATSGGATTTNEPYDGAELTLVQDARGPQGAFAVLGGKVAVFGDVASVKAAVDTEGKSAFATQPNPKAALDATDSSHVGFLYLDTAALFDWSAKAAQLGGGSATPSLDLTSGALRGMLPTWEGLALRVEGDAIVMEAAADRPQAAIGPTQNRTSTITEHVPASALIVATRHDLGATLVDLIALYRSDPATKSLGDAIDKAAALAGGVDGAIGWIGDTAFVINQADAGIEAGLLVAPTDPAAAERTLTGLRGLLALGGSQAGIAVHDEPYNGSTITTIDLGDLGTILQGAGLRPGQLGAGIPLPSGRVELAYAVTDQVVVIGSGPSFVKHVIDTTSGTSLASTDRFKALAGRVGNGTGLSYVDLAGLRVLFESAMTNLDPSGVARYEQEVKPFLAPFDAMIGGDAVNGGIATNKFIVTVK